MWRGNPKNAEFTSCNNFAVIAGSSERVVGLRLAGFLVGFAGVALVVGAGADTGGHGLDDRLGSDAANRERGAPGDDIVDRERELLLERVVHLRPDVGASRVDALELAGVGVIVIGTLLATAMFARALRKGVAKTAYEQYRANLGRGILLGLEFLVGADIIATVTAPLTWESVGLLGGIVLIRTLLSFSLETEIEGVAPWHRRGAERDRDRDQPRR